jgi:hypothetical protein
MRCYCEGKPSLRAESDAAFAREGLIGQRLGVENTRYSRLGDRSA